VPKIGTWFEIGMYEPTASTRAAPTSCCARSFKRLASTVIVFFTVVYVSKQGGEPQSVSTIEL
jgi:hypothetical protein